LAEIWVKNQVIPTVERDQPVAGREIDAGTPFGFGYLILHGREFQRSIHGDTSMFLLIGGVRSLATRLHGGSCPGSHLDGFASHDAVTPRRDKDIFAALIAATPAPG
jgi:hypothetical protein